MLQSYQPLIRFWAAVLLLCGAGAATLQALGPPPSGGEVKAKPVPPPAEQTVAVPAVPQTEVKAPAPAPSVAVKAPEPTPSAADAVPSAAPSLADVTGEAVAELPLPPPAPPVARKAAPARRSAPWGDGTGFRYGGADRRFPTRDIWGNPLQPSGNDGPDRAYSGGRDGGGYIGVYTVGPDGTRSFRAGQ